MRAINKDLENLTEILLKESKSKFNQSYKLNKVQLLRVYKV